MAVDIYKLVVGYELMALAFKHLHEIVQTLNHLLSAVVSDDERHFKLGMLLKLIELPRVEIGNEVSVVAKHTSNHPVINPFRDIV